VLTETEMDETQGVTLAILKTTQQITDDMSLEQITVGIMAAAALTIQAETECSFTDAYGLLRNLSADLAGPGRRVAIRNGSPLLAK